VICCFGDYMFAKGCCASVRCFMEGTHGCSQLRTIEILDTLPKLNETVRNYSLVAQTSLITESFCSRVLRGSLTDVPTSKLAVGSGRHSECCRSC